MERSMKRMICSLAVLLPVSAPLPDAGGWGRDWGAEVAGRVLSSSRYSFPSSHTPRHVLQPSITVNVPGYGNIASGVAHRGHCNVPARAFAGALRFRAGTPMIDESSASSNQMPWHLGQ